MSGVKYKPYPEYKDSGVEWAIKIPNNWMVKPLFAVASTESIKNDDGKENNVLSLSYGNIVKRNIEQNFGLLPESFNTYQIVFVGNIILRLTDLQNDKKSLRVGLSKEKGIITSAYLKLKAESGIISASFLYRLLHSYDTTKVFYGMGGGLRQSMKFEDIRRLPIILPSLPEQSQIAAFLDHVIAKIDKLIEKQKRLIELLKEKRQAFISHAVTKGLNPDAPMKDSGVEWLGEVPEHWEISPLKYLCTFMGGGTPSKENLNFWDNGTIPWVSPKDMNKFYISDSIDHITEEAILKSSTKLIDKEALIIVVRSGILQRKIPIGINIESITLNQDMKALRFNSSMVVEYVANVIIGNQSSLLLEWGKEGATVESIEYEYLSNSLFPVPPLEEQKKICDYLKIKINHYTNLENLAFQQISLLKKRRTALISAAVTGKIDVRDWKPPESQEDESIMPVEEVCSI